MLGVLRVPVYCLCIHEGVLSDSHTLIKFLVMEKVANLMNLITVNDKNVSAYGNSKFLCSISVFFCSAIPVVAKYPYKYM
jgi:hypothetical protein